GAADSGGICGRLTSRFLFLTLHCRGADDFQMGVAEFMVSAVISDLTRWGPAQLPTAAVPSLFEAEAYCRRLATQHYENFPVVSWLLPRGLHQHFFNVYAFCRWADDLGDEAGDPARALQLLAWWRSETERCYQGEVRHPVFVALRPTIDRFQI